MTAKDRFNMLTEELIKSNIGIKTKSKNDTIFEYETEGENQTCLGFGLYKDKEVAVQRMWMSDTTKVKKHAHGVVEWFLCISGSFTVTILDEDKDTILYEKTLFQGDGCYVNYNQWHKVKAHSDSKLLVVTIPADENFPEGV